MNVRHELNPVERKLVGRWMSQPNYHFFRADSSEKDNQKHFILLIYDNHGFDLYQDNYDTKAVDHPHENGKLIVHPKRDDESRYLQGKGRNGGIGRRTGRCSTSNKENKVSVRTQWVNKGTWEINDPYIEFLGYVTNEFVKRPILLSQRFSLSKFENHAYDGWTPYELLETF